MPIQFWGGASDTAVIVWDGVETISGNKTFTNIINGDISSNGASYFTDICANNIYFTGDISGHDASFQNLTVNGVNITGSGGGGGGSSLWTAGSGNIIYYNTGTPQVAIGLTDPSAGAALHVNGKIFASDDIQAFYSSDRRFKDNIRTIENPLESLDKLNGYRFTWNDDLSHIHSYEGEDIGVIAQEVEEVLPEIVSNRTNGYKGVKYEKIIPLLIECIKELKSEIDILKSKTF